LIIFGLSSTLVDFSFLYILSLFQISLLISGVSHGISKKQKSENIGVSPLKVNGITKTNSIDEAEALNNQFHSALNVLPICVF
jgi:hypothetical protein